MFSKTFYLYIIFNHPTTINEMRFSEVAIQMNMICDYRIYCDKSQPVYLTQFMGLVSSRFFWTVLFHQKNMRKHLKKCTVLIVTKIYFILYIELSKFRKESAYHLSICNWLPDVTFIPRIITVAHRKHENHEIMKSWIIKKLMI